MKRLLLFIFLLVPSFFSCQEDEIKVDSGNLLLGLWNFAEYQGNTAIYARQLEFADTQGFNMHADGTLVVRENAGFCGTPPITYADYGGSWNILNDTLLQVSTGYWGGTLNYKIDVESVTADSLKVIMIYEN